MSGVSALSAARGSIASALSAPNSGNTGSLDSVRVEVGAGSVIDSVWALRTSWYEGEVRPCLTDWWWRRLDSFDVDLNDPRVINQLERMRDNCLPDAQPFRCPAVIDRASDDSGIVEEILANERPWQEAYVWHRSNDLLVDMIHLQRSRW
jgi:hypothetical protein